MTKTQRTTKRTNDRLMAELDNLVTRPVFSAEAMAARDLLIAEIWVTIRASQL